MSLSCRVCIVILLDWMHAHIRAGGHVNVDDGHLNALLERQLELEQLWRQLKLAAEGRGSLVLLGAEAGAGKTALIRAFAESARPQAQVLIGACDPLSTPQPLGPLADIADAAGAALQGVLATVPAQRHELFRALLGWLGRSPVPVVLVFEDLHWADDATLDLLRFLGRRIAATPTLLIGSFRSDEVGRRHPLRVLLGDLASTSAVQRLRLSPLSVEAVGVLAAGHALNPVELHRQTGGNPFYVTEVIAAGEQGVPASVRDAVLARAARLSPEAQRTLDTAAVIGAVVEPELLRAVLEPERAAVDECVDAGVLRSEGPLLAFRHEIAREAVLTAMAVSARGDVHRKVLAALRSRAVDEDQLARLAHHAEQAGDRAAVLEFAPAAARRAAGLSSRREAAAQWARALRFADDLPPLERLELLEGYAQESALIDHLTVAIEARQEAIDICRILDDRRRESDNHRRLSRHLMASGRNAESNAACRAAIAALDGFPLGPESARAYSNYAYHQMLNRDNAEAIRGGQRAIELAERFQDSITLIEAYNFVGSSMILVGDVEQGRGHLEHSLQLALSAGSDQTAADAYSNLGSGFGEMYQFADADRYLANGIAYCTARDQDYQRLYMQAWQALSYCHQARWNAAGEVASAVLRRPSVAAISRIMALVALGRLRARRGDPGVWDALDEALELAERTATLQRLGPVRAARAEAAWLASDAAQTASEARAAYELAVAQQHPWFAGELAYWRWLAGDLDTLPDVAAEPFRLQISGDVRAAATAWERLHCPYEAARARSESDDEDELRAGLVSFEHLGARPMTTRLSKQMRERGLQAIPRGPRPATRANPAGLTARQVAVLRLIAEGLGNRAIAERLYISPKTVEHHVSAILTKLDAGDRAEAVEKARRIQLLPQL